MKRYVLALAVMLMPGALHAQDAGSAWNGLDRSTLSTVFVLDDAGVETRGQLVRLDPDAIVVLVNGAERRFETRRVERVSKRGDSLRNGAIAGLAAGIVQAVLVVGTQKCAASCSEGVRMWFLAANTAVYTAVGTAIDAAIQGRTVMYRAPTPRPANQSRTSASFSVRLTW
jgi:type IV secretory pathway TrbD component